MKFQLFFLLFTLFSTCVSAQNTSVSATIDKNCNSQPGEIRIEKNLMADSFSIVKMNGGVNCYKGEDISPSGFIIKDSLGKTIFQYQLEEIEETEFPVQLKNLQLRGGIYQVFVEGGSGASLDLKYELSKI